MYEGRLVGLREFREEDLEPVHRWVNDERLNKYLTFATIPRTLIQTREFLEAQLANRGKRDVNFVVYRLKDAKRSYIGSVGLKDFDPIHRHAELHAALGGVEYLGKGYGTDALKLLVRYGFDRLNLQKIWLSVIHFNIPGIKAYEHAGFRNDGRMRAHLHYCNEYHDLVVMSILRDEYYAKNAPRPAEIKR